MIYMHLNTDFFVVGNYAFGSNGRIMIYPKKNCGSSRLWDYTHLKFFLLSKDEFYINWTQIISTITETVLPSDQPHLLGLYFILMRESFGRLNARYESVIILIIMGMHIYTNLLIRGLALLVWRIFWRSSTHA